MTTEYRTLILDNGHGANTSGKRSPVWADGSQLMEYEFNRDIVKRIAEQCKEGGIDCRVLVPEDRDISLAERCRRANAIYNETGGKCFLISIHANAGGGTGWEAYTSPGKTKADDIATELYRQAETEFARDGWKMRRDMSDDDPDKEEGFYILKHTKCPAVLTENFFMDTEKDCRLIMSEYGRWRVTQIHYRAIKNIIKQAT
ncbi:MAG: N-acetylmuramoyl-L-alanine amidase [Bacteroidales bacterium]|nr:N-acetylmuramoyl-L-alanine amidase [Bacteroidales bacterium]MCM1147549.1 N-acetylmuramoyl-L-alanine amidase [Bacteroidales bacterium]MCM1206339.1 N-acetylmuramoyl-L-alanine amidase [Bacillota bacterium]MCM1511232.1 N-acetylmuramoyl-L-alanine amidase [Clostridium sp.]